MRQRIRNILLEAIEFKDRPNINDAFWKWFGDSKMVDVGGTPMEFHHGTQSEFTIFKMPAYFWNNYDYGDMYSGEVGFEHGRNEKSKVVSVYLKMENPFYTDDLDCVENNPKWIMEFMKKNGYDGIIFRDGADRTGLAMEYVVASPVQIKSINNQGTWNPNDPDIMK